MNKVIVFKNQKDSVVEVMGPIIEEEDAYTILELRGYKSAGLEKKKKYWVMSPGYKAVVMPLTPAPRDI